MAAGSEGESHARCRVIAQGYRVLDEERHAVDYRPSVWGDYFIKNPTLPHAHEIGVSQEDVFGGFTDNQGNLKDTLHADVCSLLGSSKWNMDEVEQLGECYKDFARFMFGTMIEIENALPEDIARRNVDTIRDIAYVLMVS
nr:unnamed protein product [Digitaria exilis]